MKILLIYRKKDIFSIVKDNYDNHPFLVVNVNYVGKKAKNFEISLHFLFNKY